MTRSLPLSAVEEAASAWFMRRRERASDAGAEQAFQSWLQASAEHRREYERLELVWEDMAALPRPDSARVHSQPASHTQNPSRSRPQSPPRAWSAPTRRPAFLRWGGALAAMLLVTAAAYQYVPISYETIANASTQTRSLDLSDGTRLHANVGTRVSVRYTMAERHIRVEGGEVYIDAAPDRRPLIVAAGDAELRDIGTEFNVLLLPDVLQVGVRSGEVRLNAQGANAPAAQTLQAGDTVLLSRADARLLRRQQVPASEIGAWQGGVAVMHDATLQQLAGYLALYRDTPLRFADERARGLRLSGTLDLRQPDAVLDMLPGLLPVTVSRRPDGAAVIGSR
ncbi:FecR domain-containing protein [Achromobacter sp. ACM04]|uniref:FecR family protein n=1 Tax=Achromobacter sp. ACM04 TaxID=2769312 RepID=UPI00177F4689|nr:FecR domain-containing protein [Achromobacter sp. ACM04]MBD9423067.1 FecR domain-containing protein [Achromobacter sp. ACM04]